MRTSRRRFVAVAGTALLAGCSGRDDGAPARDSTVTPVDVPQTAGEVLEAVESVPVPTIPAAPVVSDAHRRSVVDHVEGRIAATETALAAADGVSLSDVDGIDADATPIEACRSHLADYREAPDRLAFQRLTRTFDHVAAIHGYVRAATGDLDAEGVRTAVMEARTARATLADDVEYRLAAPVLERLPAMAAGEAALDRADDHRLPREPVDPAVEEGRPDAVADVWRRVETVRLETTNAAGYLETALDPTAPPRTDAIADSVDEHLQALASLDVPRGVEGRPLPSRVRTVLSSVRSHRSEVLSAADPTDPTTARRVELLLDAVRIRGQLEAYNVAGETTFTRLGDGGFPTERLMPAKRAAVDRVGTLAAAPPLARHLGGLADDMVTYGDRLQAGQGTNPVATAHFMYVAAQAYVDRALERSERLAAALDPDR